MSYQIQNPNDKQNPSLWIREGADPTVAIFKNKYYLFSSVSEGYWASENLVDWKSIKPSSIRNLPILRHYAPTAVTIGDTLYLKDGNGQGAVYGTKTPENPDSWKQVSPEGWHKPDAQFFLDEDGKLWISYGCSNTGFLYIQEIDTKTFLPKGDSHEFFMPDVKKRGWEGGTEGERGMNHFESHGWVEGSQLLKHNGTYYFVYSLPGLNNAYQNGVYTAKNILGPYKYQSHNPITQKLTGFSPGSGHGEIVKDRYGNWWTFVCQSVWTFDRFERRIGMFPTTIDEQGVLLSDTWLGDYPALVPQSKRESRGSLNNGMNLLSLHRPITASSTYMGKPQNVVDEEIMTYWSASTGGKNEWVQVDLQSPCLVEAVQANFCEVDMKAKKSEDRITDNPNDVIRYKVLGSLDEKNWTTIIDQSENRRDTPHDFNLAVKPAKVRYIRLENVNMPYGGKFAVRDLRVFGRGFGVKPQAPTFQVSREKNRKIMEVQWNSIEGADGYVVRYGQEKNRLYLANQYYKTNNVFISSLESEKEYFITVDAFNQSGYTQGQSILPVVASKNRYSADEAELSQGAGYDGRFVYAMHQPEASCSFHVDGDIGGEFTMILAYATADENAQCELIVNGSSQHLSVPSSGSWSTIKKIEVQVHLKSGKSNTISIKGAGHGINISYIEIKKLRRFEWVIEWEG